MPGMQDWAAVGSPITDVQLMGGLANRRRSLVGDDKTTVQGYILIGEQAFTPMPPSAKAPRSASGRLRRSPTASN